MIRRGSVPSPTISSFIRPLQMAVHGFTSGKEPLRNTLADDHYCSAPVRSLSLKSRFQNQTHGCSKNPGEINQRVRRSSSSPSASTDRKGEADAQRPAIAPGNAETGRNVLHSRQRADAALRFTIKSRTCSGVRPSDITGRFTASTCAVSNGG